MVTEPPPHRSLFDHWSRWVARHPWHVVLAWLVIVAVLVAIWRQDHGEFVSSLEIPGAESQQAVDLLRERFPEMAGDSAMVVVRAEDGLRSEPIRQEVSAMAGEIQRIPGVVQVVPPYAPEANAIAEDGSTGFMLVQFETRADAVPPESVDALYDLQEAHDRDGFEVALGGQVITAAEQEPPSTSELLGVIAAVIILLFAFGSFVAMGLPLITAFVGLFSSFMLIGLAALVLDLSPETRAFTAMIGIGVGIDYALFIVTRFRESLRAGRSVEQAVVASIGTAGRSILFAGSIVVVALLGLLTIGIPFVGALGIAAAIVVTLAVLVALTLLPSLLALIGTRIDRWRIPLHRGEARGERDTFWYRLASFSQARPWAIVVVGFALMLGLSGPALDMRIGSSDAGNNPTTSSSRKAYDLLSEGFGVGMNGPLTIAVDTTDSFDDGAVEALASTLRETEGIARVSSPRMNAAGDTAVLTVIPETSPQSIETENLVHTLRQDVVPAAVAATGAYAYVGGPTASFIDIGDRIGERLPYFFAVVIGVSVVLLALVFRSLLIPLQAAVMNMLSIGAAYGVLVMVFQWGWGSGLFGIDRTGPIESFLPMMLFAVLFGLSTDYQVFLVSRIQEKWLETGDNQDAVSHGVATTARVITAAASIMVVVFLSFTLGDARIVKEFGLGMATAVFVDATIIRMLLVPAVMGLFGRWNWYFPAALDRVLPRISIEPVDPAPAPGIR
jgi:putative drug exporter of the RND superfamily